MSKPVGHTQSATPQIKLETSGKTEGLVILQQEARRPISLTFSETVFFSQMFYTQNRICGEELLISPLVSRKVRISTDCDVVSVDAYFHLTMELEEEVLFCKFVSERPPLFPGDRMGMSLYAAQSRSTPSRSSPPRLPMESTHSLSLGQQSHEELPVLPVLSCVHKIVPSPSTSSFTIFICFI